MNDQHITYEKIAASPFLTSRQFSQIEKQVQEKHRASWDTQHKVADFQQKRTMESIINGIIMPFLLFTLTCAGVYLSGWAIGSVVRQGQTFAAVTLWAIEIAAWILIFRTRFTRGRANTERTNERTNTEQSPTDVRLLTGFLFALTILFNGISELSPYLKEWLAYDEAMIVLGVLNAFLAPVLIRVSSHYLADLCVELVQAVDASKNANKDYEAAYRQAWDNDKPVWLLTALQQGAAKNKYMAMAYAGLFTEQPNEHRTNERTNDPAPVFIERTNDPAPVFAPIASAMPMANAAWASPPAMIQPAPTAVVFGQAVPAVTPTERPAGVKINAIIDALLADPDILKMGSLDKIKTHPALVALEVTKGELLANAVRYVRNGGK